MPRRCTVCDSPNRAAIDKALVARDTPYRSIAKRFHVSSAAIYRHFAEHLPETLVRARDSAETVRATDLMAELERCFTRVNLLSDACDAWLRDAEDPARYDIGPRAEDVKVTYSDVIRTGKQTKTTKRKARLSVLLAKVKGVAPGVQLVEIKHADPRELILKTAKRLQGQLELLARLLGKIKEPAHINVFVTSEWQQVQSTILRVLAPHPAIRLKVAEALGQLSDASRN